RDLLPEQFTADPTKLADDIRFNGCNQSYEQRHPGFLEKPLLEQPAPEKLHVNLGLDNSDSVDVPFFKARGRGHQKFNDTDLAAAGLTKLPTRLNKTLKSTSGD